AYYRSLDRDIRFQILDLSQNECDEIREFLENNVKPENASYLYDHYYDGGAIKVEYFKKIVKESIIVVIISSVMGLFSGTVLSNNEIILSSFPIILLVLPSLNSLIGDMSTVLVSRLTSHLYIGTIPAKIQFSDRLKQDFYGLLITILLSLIALICLGYILGSVTGIEIVNPLLIISIISITILILFGFMFVFLFMGSILIFRKGKDPNNFLIPMITSLADFLTPLLIIIFIQLFV
ncbi:MAG: magnesium transporter, partial [Candidatus Thorarchaeota archaeon]